MAGSVPASATSAETLALAACAPSAPSPPGSSSLSAAASAPGASGGVGARNESTSTPSLLRNAASSAAASSAAVLPTHGAGPARCRSGSRVPSAAKRQKLYEPVLTDALGRSQTAPSGNSCTQANTRVSANAAAAPLQRTRLPALVRAVAALCQQRVGRARHGADAEDAGGRRVRAAGGAHAAQAASAHA